MQTRGISKHNVRCFVADVFFFHLLFVPLMLLFIVKTTRNHIYCSLLYIADRAKGPLDHKVTSIFNGAAYICLHIDRGQFD